MLRYSHGLSLRSVHLSRNMFLLGCTRVRLMLRHSHSMSRRRALFLHGVRCCCRLVAAVLLLGCNRVRCCLVMGHSNGVSSLLCGDRVLLPGHTLQKHAGMLSEVNRMLMSEVKWMPSLVLVESCLEKRQPVLQEGA